MAELGVSIGLREFEPQIDNPLYFEDKSFIDSNKCRRLKNSGKSGKNVQKKRKFDDFWRGKLENIRGGAC